MPCLLASGCGIDTDGFTAVACSDGVRPVYLAGLAPGETVDYMELREIDESGGMPSTLLESIGEKCKNATDAAACATAISAAGSTRGFVVGQCVDFCPKRILVVQSGDEVRVLDTPQAVTDLLAPIDTASEAVLAASLAGYHVSCQNPDEGGVRAAGDGFQVLATKYTEICDPIERTLYVLAVPASGAVTEIESEVIESDSGACIGRRPAGLARRKARGSTRLGAYLGSVAHLEAASVHAFAVLADELVHHGAPRSLVLRARAARRDEIRHARVMRALAARHGGVAPAPRVEKSPRRSLEEIALDNAVEGCVRETYGALVGAWQARFARDPALRRAMRRITRDETRHAELSWAIHEWVLPRLSEASRRRIEEAKRGALRDIVVEARAGNEPELVALAGMPDSVAGERLARHFEQAIAGLAG